jgi:hypothetical protein
MIKRLLLVASTNKRLEKLVTTNQLTRGLVVIRDVPGADQPERHIGGAQPL